MRIIVLLLLIVGLFACGEESKKQKKSDSITGNAAIDDITRLIFDDGNNPDLYYQRAQLYIKDRKYDNAIYDLDKAIKIDSLHPEFFHLLSDTYLDMAESKEALNVLERAVQIFPERVPSLLKMSETNFILKQYETSMLYATKVLSLNPQEAEGYFMMGMNFRADNDIEKALNSFQTAIEMDPELIDAWLILGEMYEEQKNPIAKRYLEGATEADTSNVQALHSLAFYMQNHKEEDKAIALYRRINHLDKFYTDAYLNAGVLFLEKENFESAHEQFTIMTKMEAHNFRGHYYLGLTNELMGNYDIARENYRSAQNLNPEDKKITKAIVRISEKQGS